VHEIEKGKNMSLVTIKPLLKDAFDKQYGYGGFNVNAICQAQALIDIHEQLRAPALIQVADLANGFMGGRFDFLNSTYEDKKKGATIIAKAVRAMAEDANIPVCLHLDHGNDYDTIKMVVDAGFTSVMIDGSHHDYDTNVELTREVVAYAHKKGVSVEAELGILSGTEDNVTAENSTYTNPLLAVDFIKKTAVDCLAISYGTSHGAAKGKNAKLRKEIVIAITENLRHSGLYCPLVSHGSSNVPKYIVDEINELGGTIQNANGISPTQISEVIQQGVAKVNVDTDIRLATTRNIRAYLKGKQCIESQSVQDIANILEEKTAAFDPRVYLTPVHDMLVTDICQNDEEKMIRKAMQHAVKEIAANLISQYGALGKAGGFNRHA
jgi:fructose-bisphosphate aldolase class II